MTQKTAFQKAKQMIGSEVKDTITGLTGKCTGICIYDKAYDIVQCQVTMVSNTGILNTYWYEHTRLEIVTPAED